MESKSLLCSGGAALLLSISGCSVTRPVQVGLDGPSLRTYLAEHPAANLRVTERSGRRYWVHAPAVRGDSLLGRQGYDVPARALAVPLQEVAELETSHFSVGRTGALVGSVALAAGVTLAVLIDEAQPIY